MTGIFPPACPRPSLLSPWTSTILGHGEGVKLRTSERDPSGVAARSSWSTSNDVGNSETSILGTLEGIIPDKCCQFWGGILGPTIILWRPHIYINVYIYISLSLHMYICACMYTCTYTYKACNCFRDCDNGIQWVWSFEGFGSLLSCLWPVFVLTYYLWLGPVLTYQSPKVSFSRLLQGPSGVDAKLTLGGFKDWFKEFSSLWGRFQSCQMVQTN